MKAVPSIEGAYFVSTPPVEKAPGVEYLEGSGVVSGIAAALTLQWTRYGHSVNFRIRLFPGSAT